jgi:hypothetical protein
MLRKRMDEPLFGAIPLFPADRKENMTKKWLSLGLLTLTAE